MENKNPDTNTDMKNTMLSRFFATVNSLLHTEPVVVVVASVVEEVVCGVAAVVVVVVLFHLACLVSI